MEKFSIFEVKIGSQNGLNLKYQTQIPTMWVQCNWNSIGWNTSWLLIDLHKINISSILFKIYHSIILTQTFCTYLDFFWFESASENFQKSQSHHLNLCATAALIYKYIKSAIFKIYLVKFRFIGFTISQQFCLENVTDIIKQYSS